MKFFDKSATWVFGLAPAEDILITKVFRSTMMLPPE